MLYACVIRDNNSPLHLSLSWLRKKIGAKGWVLSINDSTNSPSRISSLSSDWRTFGWVGRGQLFLKIRPQFKFVLIFFYDILVYSKDLKEHLRHLWEVLKLLRDNQLLASNLSSVLELHKWSTLIMWFLLVLLAWIDPRLNRYLPGLFLNHWRTWGGFSGCLAIIGVLKMAMES